MNHICELPPHVPAEMRGMKWKCPVCKRKYKATKIWADFNHSYVLCEWKLCGWRR